MAGDHTARARSFELLLACITLAMAGCAGEGDRQHPQEQGWVGARINQIEGPLPQRLRPTRWRRTADDDPPILTRHPRAVPK